MSKCCICNSRISSNTESSSLSESHSELKLCFTCNNMKLKLNSPDKAEQITSISYFRNKLKEGIHDAASVKALKNMLGKLESEKGKDSEKPKDGEKPKDSEEKNSTIQEYNERVQNFISVTTDRFEGYKITKYLGIVSGDIQFKTASSDTDSVDTDKDMGTYTGKLMSAREDALKRLKLKCVKRGANAVAGVHTETIMPCPDLTIVVASGTAVIIKQDT